MNKRGISPVVATIGLVLVTLTAAALIAGVIVPLVEDSLEESTSCLDYQDYFFFEEEFELNCKDPNPTKRYAFSVGAKTSDEDVSALVEGIAFSFLGDGTTDAVQIFEEDLVQCDSVYMYLESGSQTTLEVPESGEVKSYAYQTIKEYTKARVSPILKGGKVCPVTDEIDLVLCGTDVDVLACELSAGGGGEICDNGEDDDDDGAIDCADEDCSLDSACVVNVDCPVGEAVGEENCVVEFIPNNDGYVEKNEFGIYSLVDDEFFIRAGKDTSENGLVWRGYAVWDLSGFAPSSITEVKLSYATYPEPEGNFDSVNGGIYKLSQNPGEQADEQAIFDSIGAEEFYYIGQGFPLAGAGTIEEFNAWDNDPKSDLFDAAGGNFYLGFKIDNEDLVDVSDTGQFGSGDYPEPDELKLIVTYTP